MTLRNFSILFKAVKTEKKKVNLKPVQAHADRLRMEHQQQLVGNLGYDSVYAFKVDSGQTAATYDADHQEQGFIVGCRQCLRCFLSTIEVESLETRAILLQNSQRNKRAPHQAQTLLGLL